MIRSRTEGLVFPAASTNIATAGALTCTVALSEVSTGTLKEPWESTTAPAPGEPDESPLIGLQTADSSKERFY